MGTLAYLTKSTDNTPSDDSIVNNVYFVGVKIPHYSVLLMRILTWKLIHILNVVFFLIDLETSDIGTYDRQRDLAKHTPKSLT